MTDKSSETVASGVEELLRRLVEDGVAAGRAEADRIVAEAGVRAREIVAEAREEARSILELARTQAADVRESGREALAVAARDATLTLKDYLSRRFTEDVRRLVTGELEKEEVLKRLILEVAGRVRDQVDMAVTAEILLPRNVLGIDEIRRRPQELEQGELTHFVREVARDLLRDGVTFRAAGAAPGIRILLGDDGIELDLTDEAITALIMEHLQPRFRALLDGIVR